MDSIDIKGYISGILLVIIIFLSFISILIYSDDTIKSWFVTVGIAMVLGYIGNLFLDYMGQVYERRKNG